MAFPSAGESGFGKSESHDDDRLLTSRVSHSQRALSRSPIRPKSRATVCRTAAVQDGDIHARSRTKRHGENVNTGPDSGAGVVSGGVTIRGEYMSRAGPASRRRKFDAQELEMRQLLARIYLYSAGCTDGGAMFDGPCGLSPRWRGDVSAGTHYDAKRLGWRQSSHWLNGGDGMEAGQSPRCSRQTRAWGIHVFIGSLTGINRYHGFERTSRRRFRAGVASYYDACRF